MNTTQAPCPPPQKRSAGRRWLWIALGLLAGLLILALWLLPNFFDIEQQRGRIEQALRDATGWEAELGDMDLTLLSGLSLTVSPVRLGAPQDGSSAEIATVAVRAAFFPLLRGELEVKRIDLIRPDIELVKASDDEGWLLPAPAASEDSGAGALNLSIDEVRLKKGRIRIEDRTAEPPMIMEIEKLDLSLFVADGRLEGDGELADDGGEIEISGSLTDGVAFDLDDVRTEALVPMIGEGLLREGGILSGRIDLDLPERVSGRLTGSDLTLLAGEKPLDEAILDFVLKGMDGAWLIESLQIEADGAMLEGSGTLSPDLSLKLALPSTPLEVALGAADALFPLPLDLEPPGLVSATIRLDQRAGEELIYEATGDLSAARFDPGEPLPAVTDLRTAFNLGRDGRLGIDILESVVGGGPLTGRVGLESVFPPGIMTLDGNLQEAALGQLLSRLVDEAEERISGPTGMLAELQLDLSRGEIDVGALKGRLELESRPVNLPGWDIRGAIRSKIAEKRSSLSGLAALLGEDQTDEQAADDGEGALFERMDALVDFNQLPWRLERFALASGALNAVGSGSFDPVDGTVGILFNVTLDAEETAGLVGKNRELRILLDDQGRLALPVRVKGPLLEPSINVDLEKVLSRRLGVEEPEEKVKGFLKKLLD
jgi:hypothetical protein